MFSRCIQNRINTIFSIRLVAVLVVFLAVTGGHPKEFNCTDDVNAWTCQLPVVDCDWSQGEPITIPNLDWRQELSIGHTATCKWKSFPSVIFQTYKQLYSISVECDIDSLNSSDFENMTNLGDVSLYHNKIDRIQGRTFEHLTNTSYLNLSYNLIAVLEENAFGGMSELIVLDLSNNRLTSLKKNVFATNPKLQNINFEMNLISTIEKGVFDLLELTHVHFTKNQMVAFPNNLFANTPKSNVLRFGKNKLETFPQAFLEAASVVVLMLDTNPISELEIGVLESYGFLPSYLLEHMEE